ncbi:pectate lyase [Stenotrophomonas pictorum]|uniref:pectate lyase n=1 Tax=Stenotrophomonas pictorum TaxID=86184 RepID=UPI000ABBDAD2|nr:pectate lyase [Stenotrophomonas pictorum]
MNAVLRFLRALLLATLLTPAATVHAAAPTDPQAETMLLLQTASGGWSKHYRGKAVDYRRPLSAVERDALRAPGRKDDATLDNKATTSEIRYLLQAHARTGNPAYLQAARRGVSYLLAAQYPNGGWPQYYPDRSFYRHQITFNDDAMTRVLELLQDIVESRDEAALLAPEFGSAAQAALARGLDCVLATQVRIEGLPTLWAAQYDEVTLLPAKARSYELPSLAVAESVGVLRLLMRQRDPSPAQVAAVEAGVRWLQAHRLPDVALERVDAPEQESGRDVRIVQRPGASLWARFYDLQHQQPMFVNRDGVQVAQFAAIPNERRVGYAWYGVWPEKLLRSEWPAWRARWGVSPHGAPAPAVQ